MAAGIALAFVGLTAGVPLGFLVRRLGLGPAPMVVLAFDAALVVLFTLMLAQTLSAAAVSFYERGDLDLMLSSPLPPERTLAVRTMAIAGNALLLILVLFTPFVLPIALIGHPPLLAAFPVLASLGLLSSTAGLWLAMGLFAVLGPRRTKTLAQVLAAFIGAAVFIVSQTYNFLGRRGTTDVIGELRAFAARTDLVDSPASWPARAILGEPLPVLAVVGFSLVVFLVTTRTLGRRFAANAAASSGVGPARSKGKGAGNFKDGPFAALVRKEMRLISRDPAMLSQVLLQTLYMLPLAFILIRNAKDDAPLLVAVGCGAVVFVAGQLAGTLGWITISAEDSPDLLACAPVSPEHMRRAKLAAVLLPVFLLLGVPLVGLTVFNPWAGVVATAGCLASATGSGLVELWRQRPGKRTEFRRQRGGSVLITLGEALLGTLFGAAAGLAVAGMALAVFPLLLAVGGLLILKPRASVEARRATGKAVVQ